ncbi:Single hybrid motif superfamily protein isoform 2 [Hibiscus syriacus]|uniref:Protein Abitram n=1 Tax=Hibiscus syriacus TaxID=106335 RepID=A0A6A3AJD0_HIBSY|nr:Single hybrid motif superfamily protein isoform 2 [Hibiscus syriacus]
MASWSKRIFKTEKKVETLALSPRLIQSMSDIMVDQLLKPEETVVGNNLRQQHKQAKNSSSTNKRRTAAAQTSEEQQQHKQVEEQQQQQSVGRENAEYEDEELHKLLVPDITQLPLTPPSAVESNFASYYAPDCVLFGLASTHLAFKEKGGITSVDFNVGKSDRSGMKVTGKREVPGRCCVKGSLLEVNERLIKQPELLNSSPDKEGYIAIVMPKPADWLKVKASLLSLEEFKELRALC